MLVLKRKPGEKILIGDDIVVTIVTTGLHDVKVGIDAPKSIKILRDELVPHQNKE